MGKERHSSALRDHLAKILPDRWLCGILVSLALSILLASTVYALDSATLEIPGQITLQDEKLTARIAAAPLQQVMEEIGRLSKVRVLWLNQRGEESVSVEFAALPFSEAVKRILAGRNFMLFYASTADGPQPTQIWISSSNVERRRSWLEPQPVLGTTITSEVEESDGDFAQALDGAIQIALSDPDPSSRLQAIEFLATHNQGDPRARTILSQLAYNDRDPQVREIAFAVLEGMP
jgi:hypothetical protein